MTFARHWRGGNERYTIQFLPHIIARAQAGVPRSSTSGLPRNGTGIGPKSAKPALDAVLTALTIHHLLGLHKQLFVLREQGLGSSP